MWTVSLYVFIQIVEIKTGVVGLLEWMMMNFMPQKNIQTSIVSVTLQPVNKAIFILFDFK